MTESTKRRKQYEADLSELASVLREYQHSDGHCELTVNIRHGFIVLISDQRKRKPPKVEIDA